jgi:hypothetical protein
VATARLYQRQSTHWIDLRQEGHRRVVAWSSRGLDLQAVEGRDAAIEQRVRKIIEADERFVDTNLRLEVTAGQVRLRGLFQDQADVLALKHRIASVPGILDVEIDVNCIPQGAVNTPQNRASMPDAAHNLWVPPEALADVVVFLCSASSRAINGAAILVFGRS